MNQQLRTLQIALRQCLANDDVTAAQITEVIRETIKMKMDEANVTVAKSRTVLEKLRIPHHYTTCPDYLKDVGDTIVFNSSEANPIDFTQGAAQPVTMNFDGIYGADGTDTISLG